MTVNKPNHFPKTIMKSSVTSGELMLLRYILKQEDLWELYARWARDPIVPSWKHFLSKFPSEISREETQTF